MTIISHYSYLWVGGFLAIAGAILAARLGLPLGLRVGVLAAFGVVLLLGWLAIRPQENTPLNTLAEAEALFANGKPTLVELFSEYCLGCMQLEPEVNRLEAALGKRANVLRVSIHTDLGRDLRQHFAFEAAPLFIILNEQAQEVWRGSRLPRLDQILDEG